MGHIEMNRRQVVSAASAAGALATLGSTVAATADAAAPVLRAGSRGTAVTRLQNRLNQLGYWCGKADGVFGAQTVQAVLALQKSCWLTRDAVVGAKTWDALNRGLRPGSKRGGNRIEIDKTRQILMIVRGGVVKYILNTSTGSGQWFEYQGERIKAVTPSGEFRIGRSILSGWRIGPLGGLWRPFYFNGGIAVHGATEIPAYPASHGCCRVSIPAQDWMIASNYLYIGEAVSVY